MLVHKASTDGASKQNRNQVIHKTSQMRQRQPMMDKHFGTDKFYEEHEMTQETEQIELGGNSKIITAVV